MVRLADPPKIAFLHILIGGGVVALNVQATGVNAADQGTDNGPLVLVIDDIPELVEELIEMLGLVDIAARGAGTVTDALGVLTEETSIRVIVCDVRLTRESGTEIIGRIRQDSVLAARRLSLVFITGDPMQIDMFGSNIDAQVFAKPVQPRALIQCLETLLSEGE